MALAEQVGPLRIMEMCSCRDDFCASFHTRPKGDRPPGELDNVMPPAESGMGILDVVGGVITYVEVLFRDDVKAVLDAHNAGS